MAEARGNTRNTRVVLVARRVNGVEEVIRTFSDYPHTMHVRRPPNFGDTMGSGGHGVSFKRLVPGRY